MHGFNRRGEDDTDNTISDRRTADRGSLASGAESDFCSDGGEGESGWKTLPAATDELEVPVRLTSRLLTVAVPDTRGTRTERAAFIDVGGGVISDEVVDKNSQRERGSSTKASAAQKISFI